MTEENILGNPVEWVGVGVAVAGAAAAWIRAGKSNNIAASSSQTSKAALAEAKRANRTAEEANGIAERSGTSAAAAVDQAKRSADIAERVELRQVERSHVRWDIPNFKAIAHWRAENVGTDTAHDAYVAIAVNGDWQYSERKDIEPGEAITFDFAEELRAAEESRRQTAHSMAQAGIFYGSQVKLKIKYEIVWRSENGTWKHLSSEEKRAG
jgi:hypothetical protein